MANVFTGVQSPIILIVTLPPNAEQHQAMFRL